MIRRCRTTALALALAMTTLVGRGAEAQLSFSDAACRAAMAENSRKMTASVLKAMTSCHLRRMTGKADFPSTMNCNDPDQLPPRSQNKIESLRAKLTVATEASCVGGGASLPLILGFNACGGSCGHIPIVSYVGTNSVAACLACEIKAEVAAAMLGSYGSWPLPEVVGSTSPEVKCQASIGKAILKYQQARMKIQQKCQYLKDRGLANTNVDCRYDDPKGKLAKAKQKVSDTVAKDCTDVQLSLLASCASSATDEQLCAAALAEDCADNLFRDVYDPSQAVATPTPTPTETDTRSPSVTRTETPTFSQTPTRTATSFAGCPAHLFRFDVNSSGGGAFADSQWPGGNVTQTTSPECRVTVTQPSGDVVLVGTNGDAFRVSSFAGFTNCVGVGGEDGDGCQSNSCPPAGIGSCQSTRPSCSAGLNGDASASYFVQCSGNTPTPTRTSPPSTTPTQTPVCPSHLFRFDVSSSGGAAFSDSQWPGGNATQTTDPGCGVTVSQPSGDVVLVGTNGDSFTVSGFTGFTNCVGVGGEDGDGCQTNSCPPAGIASCQSARPSCSSGLNGDASASYFVQCTGQAATPTRTPTITATPTITPICPSHLFRFDVSSSGGAAFSDSQWPGGTAQQTTNPGCSITINRPSGDVVLVGTSGDSFNVSAFTGFTSCIGVGGEDGDGCQTNSCPPAGVASCQSARPSCSAGLNGDATASYFVQCTGQAATPTVTPTITNTPTQSATPSLTPICPSHSFRFDVSSSGGAAFSDSQWPGGSATQTTNPGCSITINQPSGDVVLVGTSGNSFQISGFTGFSSCSGSGGEDGDGCQVNSCPPAGIGSCQSARPSCSAGLNGDATASYFVTCVGQAATPTVTPTITTTPTVTRTPTSTSTSTRTVTPTATSVCPSTLFTFNVNSSGGSTATDSSWPGGTATQTVAPVGSCSVTIQRPSGDVVLVGASGDSFSVTGFTGFTTCVGSGGEDGDGCQTNSCPPAGIGSCQAARPSCSAGLNGDANATYFVQCTGH